MLSAYMCVVCTCHGTQVAVRGATFAAQALRLYLSELKKFYLLPICTPAIPQSLLHSLTQNVPATLLESKRLFWCA